MKKIEELYPFTYKGKSYEKKDCEKNFIELYECRRELDPDLGCHMHGGSYMDPDVEFNTGKTINLTDLFKIIKEYNYDFDLHYNDDMAGIYHISFNIVTHDFYFSDELFFADPACYDTDGTLKDEYNWESGECVYEPFHFTGRLECSVGELDEEYGEVYEQEEVVILSTKEDIKDLILKYDNQKRRELEIDKILE